jgi:bifunctional non-homologous end joining protein LigD
MARLERGSATPVRIFTRNGHDWTARFAGIAAALAALELQTAWLDGEAVVLDAQGVPSFQALQAALDGAPHEVVFYLFDLPYLNGWDLRPAPLAQRRALLAQLLQADPEADRGAGAPAQIARADGATQRRGPARARQPERAAVAVLRFSPQLHYDAADLLRSACAMHLEGVIGKRLDSPYSAGRSAAWIKLKCRHRQECVIVGYSAPAGKRSGFGALLLGLYDAQGVLHYAGRVGTGFGEALLAQLARELGRRKRSRSALHQAPRARAGSANTWLRPDRVAEIAFSEWTAEGLVRQASFVALRTDKPAVQVRRETPQAAAALKGATGAGSHVMPQHPKTDAPKRRSQAARQGRSSAQAAQTHTQAPAPAAQDEAAAAAQAAAQTRTPIRLGGQQITHPGRVIDPSTQIDKETLARYYLAVAPYLMPHLVKRPVALLRGLDGIAGELFFQKHAQHMAIAHVTQHEGLDPGHAPLLSIDTRAALIAAVQMGTIEFHTWNGSIGNLEKPDRMVFDLDPGERLAWPRMIEATQLLHTLLDELGLSGFLKTSGGKGLHVVVPLRRAAGWDEVKAFSQAVSRHLAATFPQLFTATMGPRNRVGRIFVDYLRNGRGASTVTAFSARARPGMGVSVPLAWRELAALERADQWNVATVMSRLQGLRDDPWADYAGTRQLITQEMKQRLAVT